MYVVVTLAEKFEVHLNVNILTIRKRRYKIIPAYLHLMQSISMNTQKKCLKKCLKKVFEKSV